MNDLPFDPTQGRRPINSSDCRPQFAHGSAEVFCRPNHSQQWYAYHRAHPSVFSEFCTLAEKMRVGGRREHYSVEILINVLRWHRDFNAGPDQDFKINNNYKAYYARMYQWYYDCPGFFRNRASDADLMKFPELHRGILRGRIPEPK